MKNFLKPGSAAVLVLAAAGCLSTSASAFDQDGQAPGVYFAKERQVRVAALQDLSRPTSRARTSTRTLVDDPTGKPAGNITIISKKHVLLLSLGGGKALRYEIGVGRPGFKWSGNVRVGRTGHLRQPC
jgi:lipoprotein-anchoring transpeptidase ErfK/SrfK